MTSKAARKRNKRKFRMPKNVHIQPKEAISIATETSTRPTPQRLAQGKWATPQGAGKSQQPMVDLASDMIGALYEAKKISIAQEQAARLFQQLRDAYLAEFDLSGFKSCLAGGVSGYDDSDGNPEAKKAYEDLEKRIGMVKTAILEIECAKGPDRKPNDLIALHRALDAVAGY